MIYKYIVILVLCPLFSSCSENKVNNAQPAVYSIDKIDIVGAETLVIANNFSKDAYANLGYTQDDPQDRGFDILDGRVTKLYSISVEGTLKEATYQDSNGDLISSDLFSPIEIKILNKEFTLVVFSHNGCSKTNILSIFIPPNVIFCGESISYFVRNNDGMAFRTPRMFIQESSTSKNTVVNASEELYYNVRVYTGKFDDKYQAYWHSIVHISNFGDMPPKVTQSSFSSDHDVQCFEKTGRSTADASLCKNSKNHIPDFPKDVKITDNINYDKTLWPFAVDAERNVFYQTSINDELSTRVISANGDNTSLIDYIPVFTGPDGYVYGYPSASKNTEEILNGNTKLYRLIVGSDASVTAELYYEFNGDFFNDNVLSFLKNNDKLIILGIVNEVVNGIANYSIIEIFNTNMKPIEYKLAIPHCSKYTASNNYIYCIDGNVAIYRMNLEKEYFVEKIDLDIFGPDIVVKDITHISPDDALFIKAVESNNLDIIEDVIDIDNNGQTYIRKNESKFVGKRIIDIKNTNKSI